MMGGKQRKKLVPTLPIIVSMIPLSCPSAWLHPCRTRPRFTQRSHCSSAPSISLNFRIANQKTRFRCCCGAWISMAGHVTGVTPKRRANARRNTSALQNPLAFAISSRLVAINWSCDRLSAKRLNRRIQYRMQYRRC